LHFSNRSFTPSFSSDALSVFCTQFSDMLLIYCYLKTELSDGVLGVCGDDCASTMCSAVRNKQDTVTGVWEERESANSPRLYALLTYELHVAGYACICVLNTFLNPRRIIRMAKNVWLIYEENAPGPFGTSQMRCGRMSFLSFGCWHCLVTLPLSSQNLWEESKKIKSKTVKMSHINRMFNTAQCTTQ